MAWFARRVTSETKWIPFYRQLPDPDQYVFVKLADGRIHRARWSKRTKNWSCSPFVEWGAPIAWAVISPLDEEAG